MPEGSVSLISITISVSFENESFSVTTYHGFVGLQSTQSSTDRVAAGSESLEVYSLPSVDIRSVCVCLVVSNDVSQPLSVYVIFNLISDSMDYWPYTPSLKSRSLKI